MTTNRSWTDAEDRSLRRLYATHSAAEIGERLGRSWAAVKNRAHALRLRKTENSGRFQAGITPWNKGRQFDAGGRSAETRFRKGMTPNNWRPIGSERTSPEGYLQRKMTDTGVTHRDYVPVHHLVWRMHGGAVPNHRTNALVFIDGDKRNFDINNLELVSRAELLRRNSVHNLPPEVVQIIQLRAQVVRQINKRERKSA